MAKAFLVDFEKFTARMIKATICLPYLFGILGYFRFVVILLTFFPNLTFPNKRILSEKLLAQ